MDRPGGLASILLLDNELVCENEAHCSLEVYNMVSIIYCSIYSSIIKTISYKVMCTVRGFIYSKKYIFLNTIHWLHACTSKQLCVMCQLMSWGLNSCHATNSSDFRIPGAMHLVKFCSPRSFNALIASSKECQVAGTCFQIFVPVKLGCYHSFILNSHSGLWFYQTFPELCRNLALYSMISHAPKLHLELHEICIVYHGCRH